MSGKSTEIKWLRNLLNHGPHDLFFKVDDGGKVGSFLIVMEEVPLVKKTLDFEYNKGNKEPIKKLEIDLSDYTRQDVIAFLDFHYFGEANVILSTCTDIKDIYRLYMLFDYLGCPMTDYCLRKTFQVNVFIDRMLDFLDQIQLDDFKKVVITIIAERIIAWKTSRLCANTDTVIKAFLKISSLEKEDREAIHMKLATLSWQ